MIENGKPFPAFSLPDQDGKTRSLGDYAGKWLVAYFYPRDNTPGCSMEAQAFAALIQKYATENTAVVGVSADSVKSHANFAEKFSLPFSLLSDPEQKLLGPAGVWQKKKMAGREYMGIVRSTYVIDPKGIVRASWAGVKVPGHAEAVLEKLREMQA